MNTAHWHLLFNHLPIIGTLIGALILIFGSFFRNQIIKQTALAVFVFSALTALPAFFTGEGAEDVVENLQGVSEQFIEKHEDLGKIFLAFVLVTGVFSILTYLADLNKSKFSRLLFTFVFLLSIGSVILGQQVGTSGGEIRHTEIRQGNSAGQGTDVNPPSTGEKDDD